MTAFVSAVKLIYPWMQDPTASLSLIPISFPKSTARPSSLYALILCSSFRTAFPKNTSDLAAIHRLPERPLLKASCSPVTSMPEMTPMVTLGPNAKPISTKGRNSLIVS